MRNTMRSGFIAVVVMSLLVLAACAKKQPPVAAIPQPPPNIAAPPSIAKPEAAPRRVDEALPVPAQPVVADDAATSRTLDDLNRNSPFKPVFFTVDSADLDETGRAVASANAELMKKNPTWVITVEGHCDERGTAEYNLALGGRRASAAKDYLVSLGIGGDRITTVSKGKEQPVCTEETEACWQRNRRGLSIITAK